MISDELRRQADNFIELEELKDVLGRPPREADGAPRTHRGRSKLNESRGIMLRLLTF